MSFLSNISHCVISSFISISSLILTILFELIDSTISAFVFCSFDLNLQPVGITIVGIPRYKTSLIVFLPALAIISFESE
jgi:hypothetical protein